MSGNRQFIGVAEGTTLSDAVLNGMKHDHQFKTNLRHTMSLDSNEEVELHGVPKEQVRSTVLETDLIESANE